MWFYPFNYTYLKNYPYRLQLLSVVIATFVRTRLFEKMKQRVARAALLVLHVGTLAVVDIDALRLAPVLRGYLAVVDVISVGLT